MNGPSSSQLALHLLLFSFLRFKYVFIPEGGNLVELCLCAACCAKGAFKSILFLDQVRMLSFESFLLLDTLAMKDRKTELKLTQLAIVVRTLLL